MLSKHTATCDIRLQVWRGGACGLAAVRISAFYFWNHRRHLNWNPHLIVWREEHKIRFYVPYSQSAIVLSGFLSSNSVPTSLKWCCLFKTQRGAVPKPAIRIIGTKTVKAQSLILYLIRQLKKSIWIQQSASTNTEHWCLQRHVDLKALS